MTSSNTARPSRGSGTDVATAASGGSASRLPQQPPSRWTRLLVTGFCFGVGYGVVHRLMTLQLPQLVQLDQPFEVRPFPGTSLESLRLRVGAAARPIRADLGALELEEQQRQEAATPPKPLAQELPPQPEPEPAPEPLPPAEPAVDLPLPADPVAAPGAVPADPAAAPTP